MAAPSRLRTRGRITRDTDAQGSSQDAIHSGVGGEDDAAGLEPPAQVCLQVSGDRDHDWGGLLPREVIDQVELLFWSQRGLQDDDVVECPSTASGLGRADGLDRDAEAPGGGSKALREQEFVLDQEQASSHRPQNSARSRRPVFWPMPKGPWRLL
jgi:hypothetical protein